LFFYPQLKPKSKYVPDSYKLELVKNDFRYIENWIISETGNKRIISDNYSFIDIYSNNRSPYRLLYNIKLSKLILYSVGPDQEDNYGQIMYDPTNGSHSIGDIIMVVPSNE
jgi:hypothetical protein